MYVKQKYISQGAPTVRYVSDINNIRYQWGWFGVRSMGMGRWEWTGKPQPEA